MCIISRMTTTIRPFLLAAAPCLALVLHAQALSLEFEVRETTGSEARQFPTQVVIPLPEGGFQGTEKFRLYDAAGKEVPAQFNALNRWWAKDNSIRNLQALFNADVAAGGSARYVLHDDGPGPARTGLTVTETADQVTVATGPLKFAVGKATGKLVDQAWFDLDGDGQFSEGEAALVETAEQGGVLHLLDGQAALPTGSLKGAVVTVEEKGPQRAVIRIETFLSTPGNSFGYKARIYAHRGRADIKIDFTLKNDPLGATGRIFYFDDFTLRFRPKVDASKAVVRFGSIAGGPLGAGSRLYQDSVSFAVEGALTGNGSQAQGWIDVSAPGGAGLQAVVRDFHQNHPKGLEASSSGEIAIGLWPRQGQDGAGLYWLGDMQYKTHTVWIRFHPGDEPESAQQLFAKLANRNPVSVVPVAWLSAARQPASLLGVFPLAAAEPNPYFEPSNRLDTLGWRNWWNNGRKRTITTGGTPLTWNCDQFHVSGDPKWYYRAEAWARHSADIRPTHLSGYSHPMSKQWAGFVAGGYDWESWRKTHVAYAPGTAWDGWYPYDDNHPWVHEMETAFYLTGDRLLSDNLANIGEIWKARLEEFAKRGQVSARAMAWIFEMVRIQHTLTGDSQARDLMAKVVDTFSIANQDPYLGCTVYSQPSQTFEMGMIAHHLSAFYRELPEGDTKRRAFGILMGINDYFTVHSWADNNNGVGRRPSEKATPYYSNDDMGDIIPLMHAMTGRMEYREKAQRIASNLGTWWPAWKGGRAGRMMTYVLKQGTRDTQPAAPVADLEALYTERSPDLVLLSWTVPQDARRYDARASRKDIVERLAAPGDTAKSENWWHARGFGSAKAAAAAGGRDWMLVTTAGARDLNFAIRSFDSMEDEANLSALSAMAKPKCCFNPDTLPAAVGRTRDAHSKAGKWTFNRLSPRKGGYVIAYVPPAGALTGGVGSWRIRLVDGFGRHAGEITPRLSGSVLVWEISGLSKGVYTAFLDRPGTPMRRLLVFL